MPERTARHDALRIAVAYAVIALVWIVGTDFLTRAWIPDVEQARWLETLKGGAFAVGTGALLFWWLRRVFVEREEELQDLRTLTEQVPDFVFRLRLRPEVAFEYVSPAAENLAGYTPEELYRDLDRVIQAVHPEDREKLRGLLSDPDSIGDSVELRWLHKDGRTVAVEFRLTRHRDQSGHVEVVEGIARDVTDRRDIEARLRESRDRFETLFRGSPAGIIVTRVDDGTIVDVNEAYLRIIGYDRDEVLGRTTTELGIIDPDLRTSVIRSLLDAEVGHTDQYVLHKKDGDDAVVLASAEQIRLRGEPHLLVMAQDITEHRSLERQLREAQKMEAVGRLAGGIAHDFNNLLTVIRSQADMVLMDLGASSSLAEDMGLIRDSADRAARLTRQLLAFSREQILELRVVDLNEVLRGMRELLERTLGEQVRIRADFEEGIDPVRVDPVQLEQVVVNLAVNARDAMPNGGVLTLSTDTESGTIRDGGFFDEGDAGRRFVKLEVSDTGVGMDEATMGRIFEPFFTTKREAGGTGLGLATSYGIVRQSGGTIEVHSTPGSGSTFVLRFPAAEGPVEWPEEESPQAVEPGAVEARVLVVEDDSSVRAVARKILQRAGVQVRTAEDVGGARKLIEDAAEDFDLLLTDLVLPGGSGRDLVDVAREEAPHLKVVVMSGYAEDSSGNRNALPRDVGFIQKPFTPETLLARLREMLAEDEPRS